jgi:uncharacterized membrane protein
MTIAEAAPLGLVSVIAGSVAAGRTQLRDGAVNHRFAVVTELGATAGVIVGVILAGSISDRVLTYFLATLALLAAGGGAIRKGVRWRPDPSLGADSIGEHHGSLSGVYRLNDQAVPYQPTRMGLGVSLMAIAGVVTGLAGVGGGFLKTPLSSEVMRLPAKVAAATSTFTIGLTAGGHRFDCGWHVGFTIAAISVATRRATRNSVSADCDCRRARGAGMNSLSSFVAKWTTTAVVLAALTASAGVIARGDIARTLSAMALVLLSTLPVLRVVALAVSWARAGDRRYAAAAVVLVALMAVGVLVVAVWR